MKAALGIAWLSLHLLGVEGALRFAASLESHMVLQRGPASAVVWGFADTVGSDVTVTVSGGKGSVTTKVVGPRHGGSPTWKAKLPPITDTTPFTVTASGHDGSAKLDDVLFGDVWLCSGQSNMEFNMNQLENASTEMAGDAKYTDIRFMNVQHDQSNVAIPDLRNIGLHWGPPTQNTVKWFSAVCFLFAKKLKEQIKYPIGLVESNWGGTRIEPWSSTEALQKCPITNHRKRQIPSGHTVLWNAMMEPLTSMTIKGALWYQGESNTGQFHDYACQFPAMIEDWRQKFHDASLAQTSRLFPFGFVQLAGFRDNDSPWGFPDLRWSQTAELGITPNSKMLNVFMAVAMDLPDFQSPHGAVHPRDKFDVAERLVLGARNLAYGDSSVQFQGPYPSGFALDQGHHGLKITYKYGPINVLNNNNFDVCCSSDPKACAGNVQWAAAPMTSHDANSVTVSTSACGTQHVTGVRYAWRESPCHLKQCAVYGSQTALPAPPFMKTNGFH